MPNSNSSEQQVRSGSRQSPQLLYSSRSISSGTHSDEFLDALEVVSDRSESVEGLSASPTMNPRLATTSITSLGSTPELYTYATDADAAEAHPLVTSLTQSLALLSVAPPQSPDSAAVASAATDAASGGGDAVYCGREAAEFVTSSPDANRETQHLLPSARRSKRRPRVHHKSGSSTGSTHGEAQLSPLAAGDMGNASTEEADAVAASVLSSNEPGTGHVSTSPDAAGARQPWRTVNRSRQKPKPTLGTFILQSQLSQLSQMSQASSHSASSQQSQFELKKHSSSSSGTRFKQRPFTNNLGRPLPQLPQPALHPQPIPVEAAASLEPSPVNTSPSASTITQSQPQHTNSQPQHQSQSQSQAADSSRTLSTTSSGSLHSSHTANDLRAVTGTGTGTFDSLYESDRAMTASRRGNWQRNYSASSSSYGYKQRGGNWHGGRGGARAFADAHGTPPDSVFQHFADRSFLLSSRAVSGPIRTAAEPFSDSGTQAHVPDSSDASAAATTGNTASGAGSASPRPRNDSLTISETVGAATAAVNATATRGRYRGGPADSRASRGQYQYSSYASSSNQQRGGGHWRGVGRGGYASWRNLQLQQQQQSQRAPRGGRYGHAAGALDPSQLPIPNPFLKEQFITSTFTDARPTYEPSSSTSGIGNTGAASALADPNATSLSSPPAPSASPAGTPAAAATNSNSQSQQTATTGLRETQV